MRRYTVYYSGHVQGVGFRYSVCDLALDFAVAGYVQNLPDGRVRLVVEGEREQLDRFLEGVEQRLGRFVRQRTVAEEAPSGEFGKAEPGALTIRH